MMVQAGIPTGVANLLNGVLMHTAFHYHPPIVLHLTGTLHFSSHILLWFVMCFIQVLLMSEALSSRIETLLEVENSLTWLTDKCR